MEIDRARFLLLTASLAGGCSSTPAEVVTPPAPADTGEIVVAETGDPGTTSGSETTSETAVGETTSESTTSSSSETASAPCDNDTGTVGVCSVSAPPGPHCEGLSEARASCKGFKNALRAGVAAKAVACLSAGAGLRRCVTISSRRRARHRRSRTACIQPSTFNLCSPVVAQCSGYSWGKLTMADCQGLLSSVKDGKRREMVTCMTEGCSIDSCAWQLR
ncbi:MAG: hypothetical protein R3B70_12880 [Polyangiaceae bacterium]